MAWVTPSVKILGDLITAAVWNQDIVANTLALHSRSCCIATDANNQTVENETLTSITFDTEVIDTDGYHSASAARFYAPVTGVYAVHARAKANGDINAPKLTIDGGDFVPPITEAEPNNLDDIATINAIVYMTAGQYLLFRISGASATRVVNPSYFAMVLEHAVV